MLDIKSWLENTNLKVAEDSFMKPPELPYIIFTDKIITGGADNLNCITDRSISIELYSNRIDKNSEILVENLFNQKAISYTKDRICVDKEKFFQTVYGINLIEKNIMKEG